MTTHAVVPAEYLSIDYGFSAIDESAIRKADVVDTPVESTSSADILRIEEKINALTSLVFRLEERGDENVTEAQLKDKIRKLEQIIVPLLNNLLKTADKEYILWPNRGPVVQKQLDAVLAITRG
jgi:hypothetical protein